MNRTRKPLRPKSWDELPLLMTTSEAALLLDMTVNSVQRLCASGDIPAKKIGDTWRILRDNIRKMMEG